MRVVHKCRQTFYPHWPEMESPITISVFPRIFGNQGHEVWACNHLWALPKFQGHQKWFRPWIVMKGEKFCMLSTWVRNYNTSHLSYPWTDLIRLRPQTPMDRSLLASPKLTNALSHPWWSYFLPYPLHTPKFPSEENCSQHISPTTAAI